MYTIGDLLPHSLAWFFFVQHYILLFQRVIKFNIDKKTIILKVVERIFSSLLKDNEVEALCSLNTHMCLLLHVCKHVKEKITIKMVE
jgi:hypothetical protein